MSINLIQEIFLPYEVTLCIQREDLVHPQIQGNKYRKLRYNLAFAKANSYKTLITFGGAYSNHIAATAIAGSMEGFKTVGIIRGEELGDNLENTLAQNPTLSNARNHGMDFVFISRATYREKDTNQFKKRLLQTYPDAYLIPEGGTNELAIKGCAEIIDGHGVNYDYICCPVGTGGTISGIIKSSEAQQKVLGFPALKGNFLSEEIKKWTSKTNWELISEYHFGGYAKMDAMLITFINTFLKDHNILLDPVYTGKMMFGLVDLISKGYFPSNSRILAIHTGGLQGIKGMNQRLLKKGLPIIQQTE